MNSATKSHYQYSREGGNLLIRWKRFGFWLLILFCSCKSQQDNLGNNELLPVGGDPVINAEFPGGMNELKTYFNKNMCYPDQAIRDSFEGKIFVGFVIDSLGKVKDVSIKRGQRPDVDKIVLEAAKNMPDWKPATIKDVPVSQRYVLPVIFKMENQDGYIVYSPKACSN